MKYRKSLLVVVSLAVLGAALVFAQAGAASVENADKLFEQKHYKEAAEAYRKAMEDRGDRWRYAAQKRVQSLLRLELFDEALDAAEEYVEATDDTPWEARSQRFLGNLYMTLPHWGHRAGGEFKRGQHGQGIYLRSWRYDKKRAVAHMEKARELYAHYDENREELAALPEKEREGWHEERIESIFDLANVVAQFSIYDDQPYYWYHYWGERDEFLAETAGEDDFDEGYSSQEWRRKRPNGLRVGPDGEPIFPTKPEEYSGDLGDDRKILYLLAEVRALDKSDNLTHTAQSYYRQAMLARKRFGMDRLNSYASYYHVNGRRPLQEQLNDFQPWELEDDEALVLAGGRLMVADLPPQFDVLGLLRQVYPELKASGVADEARYAAGLYYQTRQQYAPAIDEYNALLEEHAGSEFADDARNHIATIRRPEVLLSDSNVQLPGKPAEVQFSYRNLEQVHLVARKVDAEAVIKELRAMLTDASDRDWWTWRNALSNWHHMYATNDHRHRRDYYGKWQRIAARHLGAEVARWTAQVPDDGSHRYAHALRNAPLQEPGAYVIYAYTEEPPDAHRQRSGMDAMFLGESRMVLAMTDVAFVEKNTKEGKLIFVTHAGTGAPLANVDVTITEAWRIYDRKNNERQFRTKIHELKTDRNGFVTLDFPDDRNNSGSHMLHITARAGQDRLAWSNMSWWGPYRPGHMENSFRAYTVTDRPVYRPGQAVHIKAWIRHMLEGQYVEPDGLGRVRVTVNDSRGNKKHQAVLQPDQFGAVDTEFTLGEEPHLGSWRVSVELQTLKGRRTVGGTSIRVEEYKKPEFEVTVEPGEDLVKLGGTVDAVIKANYYFGAPVTDAKVQYRVFREEYRHSWHPPGRWDWLYGPGYGYTYYDYDWYPWWGYYRSYCLPPIWWGSPRSPVRELVKQGTARVDENGEVHVEIDTSNAAEHHGDLDHRYVVEADVTDASRRTISGQGAVKVTRQAYYAYVNTEAGWHRPGEDIRVTIKTLTPNNEPVQTEGVVTISRVKFGGPNNAEIENEELERFRAETGEDGTLTFRRRWERSGQLKIEYTAPDRWGGQVKGYGLLWVVGRDFDGKLYKFDELELITDKRTYQPGETAHLMVNTAQPNSYVLFAPDVDSGRLLEYRLLHLPDGHTVVDVPVKETDKPNFFVEAVTVSQAHVFQQSKEILVPPADGVMDVAVQFDKDEYKPGEMARVTVNASLPDGSPAKNAQFALSAFDESILYIQPEVAPPIAQFYHGRKRHHHPQMQTNLLYRLSTFGSLTRPYQRLLQTPPAWNGTWGLNVEGWHYIGDKQFFRLGGGGFGYNRRRQMEVAADGMALGRAAGAPMAAEAEAKADTDAVGGAGGGGDEMQEPTVRQEFADSALWLASLVTDEDGTATTEFQMPENLTTWALRTWGMTRSTRVGQAGGSAVTSKNLLVRLQAPRFFVERDEVVISANVHNYLSSAKTARVGLELPNELMELMDGYSAEREVTVPQNGEVRVDWRVKVLMEGNATITVKALTDEESDAMAMSFPVLVHGILKQDAWTGHIPVDTEDAEHTFEITVPEQRKPEQSRLVVQYSPSLAGAMMDALPYLLDYPHKSSDATVYRFVPAVLTLQTLRNMGIDLEDVKNIRGRHDEATATGSYANNPVFDSDRMHAIIQKCLRRIERMQNNDGGWGWWESSDSSEWFTVTVLDALLQATEAGVQIDQNMIQRGMNWLKNDLIQDVNRQRPAKGEKRKWPVNEYIAFEAYVLSQRNIRVQHEEAGDLVDALFERRDRLNVYGKALLAITLANVQEPARATTVLRNIMQYRQDNEETGVTWFRTPRDHWWYWWNNDIESNAWVLRAIVRIDPDHEAGPGLVKWLLENRRNGYYWRSVRDTAQVVAAFSEFAKATGETEPDYTLTISIDGGQIEKKVRINKDNFFTYDNQLVVEGVALTGGKHTVTLKKEGKGAVYWNAWLRYFTKEENIKGSGLQLKVERTYYLLKQIPFTVEVETADGGTIEERRLRYERIPLQDGDRLESGDIVQVELRVTSDNDYTYIVFEDMKPAGCEPVALRSGGERQEGFWSHMELRDEKVEFFVADLRQGEHLLRYRLRAEVPGVFHALPTSVQAMYAPELRGTADEYIMTIVDEKETAE